MFRYFYNHLSNYTKTNTRLRLVNIGEYLGAIMAPGISVKWAMWEFYVGTSC